MDKGGKNAVRFMVLITQSFLCFGPYYLYDTVVSLQPILIGPPCSLTNVSIPVSENCCESCLGFNPLEYNVLVGLPLALSTIAGLFSGFIVDRYGYCLFTFISTLFMIGGAVVRALGARPGLSHTASYTLMLVGGTLTDNVFTIIYMVKLYVAARWFSGKYLSFVIGISFAISLSGGVVAYYVNPILVGRIGLENTLWWAIPFGSTTVIAALLLWVAEKIAEGKDYGTKEQTQRPTLSFDTIKSLDTRFWMVCVTIAIAWLIFYAFIGNSVAYQTDIFKVKYELASFSSGVMYITKIIFSPIAGLIADHFDIHGPVTIVGCLCNLSGLSMFVTETGPPIVIFVLMGLGFAIVYTIEISVVTELVSFEKLATANGIMNGFIVLAIGIGDISVGIIANSQKDRVQGWLYSGIFLLAVAVFGTMMIILLFVVDAQCSQQCCWRRSNEAEKKEPQDSEYIALN